MAQEIRITANIQHTKNPRLNFQPNGLLLVTQTGVGVFAAVLSIGTSEEDVAFTDITTEGICVLWNLDSTNFVQWGKKDGSNNMQAIGKLMPGEYAVFRMDPTATLRMLADTATCKVQVICYED